MAYKSSFLGTFDQESNTSKSGSYTSPFTGTFAAKKKRKEEEDANRNYAEELKKEQQKQAEQAQKEADSKKSFLDRVGDVGNGVKNFGKEVFVDPAVNAYTGIKDVVEGSVATKNQSELQGGLNDIQNKANKQINDIYGKYIDAGKTDKNGAADESKMSKADLKTIAELKSKRDSDVAQYKKDTNFDAQSKENQKQFDESQKVDARKTAVGAAETFLNVATLGVGTGAKAGVTAAVKGGTVLAEQGAKQATKTAAKVAFDKVVGQGAKGLAKEAGKDAIVGGAYGALQAAEDPNSGLDEYGKNILFGAAIGAGAPVAFKGAGKLVKAGDKAAGKAVSKAAANVENEAVQRSLKQIGEDGIMGTLNKSLSRTSSSLAYKASDALQKTKVGAKAVDLKDDFMSKWVTEFHPLYKTLKRSDFEGKTQGAYLAAREAIGNSNRALSYAQDFVETNPNMQRLTAGIAADGKDLVKARANFDEFAKIRSELDLAAAGKKQFGKKKLAEYQERMAKVTEGGKQYDEQYKQLVGFYKDLNDFRLKNGLISKEQHKAFADEGFDYVRQQRELPDWMLDKPAAKGRGSAASITKSDAVQRRSKYASSELLSPMETAIKTAQLAHVEAYRNKAAKTVVDLLDQTGGAKIIRSTDLVREKQRLLKGLKETKPIVTKINRVLKTSKSQVRDLRKEISWLNKQGRTELKKNMRETLKELNKKTAGKDTLISERQMMETLVSLDSTELRKLRRMVEGRNAKLEPLLDRVEALNGLLSDVHKARSGMYQEAQAIKTTVNKGSQTTMSFLDDGVENVAKIDPDIASAVHNWDKQSQNVMNEVLRFSNNVFKYGTTGANVGFALPNFVADQVSSAINSKSLMSTHNPVNFVHSLFMTLSKPLNAEDSKILNGYIKANKGQLSINQYTKAATANKAANKLVRQGANWKKGTYSVIRHPKEGMRALFDGVEGAIGVTENLTRVQNYRGTLKKAVKEGKGANATRLANQAARENSVDFLEMGSYGRVINSLIPYFNASIQGSRVMLRNAAERPASFAAKTTALIGGPLAATTAWNTMDKDRKAIYDTIPDYLKETNFIVITPGAKWNEDKKKWDGVWMMKKPPGVKEFAEPVRKFIEYKADGGEDIGSFLRDEGGSVASDFANAVQPIDFSSPNKFLSSVTPQLLKPTAQAILNKDFFQGTDIVPEYLQSEAAGDQRYEHYSQLTSHIAAMFNTSPLKVDSWIKSTFGEVGTNAVHYADRLSGASPEATGGRSLTESVSRRFYGAQGGADADAFYKSYEPASNARKQASSKVTELVKAGRINEAKRRAEEYNATIKNRFESFIGKYADSPNYDPKWDERINDLYIPTTDRAFTARKRN